MMTAISAVHSWAARALFRLRKFAAAGAAAQGGDHLIGACHGVEEAHPVGGLRAGKDGRARRADGSTI